MKKTLVCIPLAIIATLSAISLSSCGESKDTEPENKINTSAPTIEVVTTEPTEETTEEPTSTEIYYEFDENTYYSTPDGIFNKSVSPTNEDGNVVIIPNEEITAVAK